MINKKERTIELYKLVGAEMRLFRTLGGNLAIHMSQVLLSTDTDKFMRVLQKIDEVRSRAEDNMFTLIQMEMLNKLSNVLKESFVIQICRMYYIPME